MKIINIILFVLLSTTLLFAQESERKSANSIFESLATTDSTSGAKVVVLQDERIEAVLANRKSQHSTSATTSTMAGYRVQVFSSNIQRTAKAEAYKIEQEMVDAFPEYKVYVTYSAPFWKVRIGDFRTMQEAKELREEISKQFSTLRSYTYTVRDQINH